MAERIAMDSGPLIALAKGGVLDACLNLPLAFVITPIVEAELERGEAMGLPRIEISSLPVRATKNKPDDMLAMLLDPGEASVIQLVEEGRADVAYIDELEVRAIARARGVALTGSAALLVVAKRKGLVTLVRPVLDKMVAAGVRLSPALLKRVLSDAGEGAKP